MFTITQELHGIEAEKLREYLISLGGENRTAGEIAGPQRIARISRLPDYRIGQASFCCFLVEIEGEAEVAREIARQFDLRIMRPRG